MNAEIKKQWVDALRSGKYPQGKDALKCNGTLCCLGVLCNLHAKATNRRWRRLVNSIKYSYMKATTYPPYDVSAWSSLYNEEIDLLAKMNDEGKSFSEIADWIEENL